MIRFTYKKRGILIEQQWFTGGKECDCNPGTGVLIIHGVSEEDIKRGERDRQDTLLTDLTASEDDIYSLFKKNTKYEIRRAEKEGAIYKAYFEDDITEDLLYKFSEVYEKMYQSKGLNRKMNMPLMKACHKEGCLAITTCSIGDELIIFHSYLYDECNTRLYQSCSLFRDNPDETKIIGMSNRGLHWYDMRLFKQRGIKQYDWGGVASLNEPNGIDKFKMGFGGTPKTYFNVTVPMNLSGKLAVTISNKLHK